MYARFCRFIDLMYLQMKIVVTLLDHKIIYCTINSFGTSLLLKARSSLMCSYIALSVSCVMEKDYEKFAI